VEADGKQKYAPPKRPLALNGLQGVISQKIVLSITAVVRTSIPISDYEILQHEECALLVVFKYTEIELI
jgi:hypothetical protein